MSIDNILNITLVKGVGPITAKMLIAEFGGVDEVFRQSREQLSKVQGLSRSVIDAIVGVDTQKRIDEELAFMERFGIEAISYLDDEYPVRLNRCDDAPVVIYKKGGARLNAPKVLSIVGTRTPTEYGKELCEHLISELSQRHPDLLIVSGLAYGVDVCAHKAAMKSGVPTVGVLGHGLDTMYPAAHRNVASQMLANGCLLTEYMSKSRPDPQNFVQRNRIVAGIADATLVIESGVKGGSLITANLAHGYNRDVLAVPGAPNAAASQGCNSLIKRNIAALVESTQDIEYALGWSVDEKSTKAIQGSLFIEALTDEEKAIYNVLAKETEMSASALSVKCKVPVGKVSSLLLGMEFSGWVKALPGNNFKVLR